MTFMVCLLAKISRVSFLICFNHLIFFCQILGPWKKKCLSEVGVVTQCISPVKITDQYLTNVLLKINSKVNDYLFFYPE